MFLLCATYTHGLIRRSGYSGGPPRSQCSARGDQACFVPVDAERAVRWARVEKSPAGYLTLPFLPPANARRLLVGKLQSRGAFSSSRSCRQNFYFMRVSIIRRKQVFIC